MADRSKSKHDRSELLDELSDRDDGRTTLTQYCRTPRETIDATIDPETGKYLVLNEVVEVPLNQYDECVELIRQAIRDGKVHGVSDEAEAERIVLSGEYTYLQSHNIARAGNIDSLQFDEANKSVTSNFLYAISFSIRFARGKWSGQSNAEALKGATIGVGETSLIAGIIAKHASRTNLIAAGAVAVRVNMNRIASSQLGRSAMQRLAGASFGRAASGFGALSHVTKLLRSNAISAILLTLTMSVPDFYRSLVSKRMSWGQFGKNFASNAIGVVGGVLGWFWGSDLGTFIGNWLGSETTASVLGILGALTGGIVGCIVVAIASRSTLDRFVKDDMKKMLELLNESVHELATDFLLAESECDEFAGQVKVELGKLGAKWLREMYRVGVKEDSDEIRKKFAYDQFDPLCQRIIAKRERIVLPDSDQVRQEIERTAAEVNATISSESVESGEFDNAKTTK